MDLPDVSAIIFPPPPVIVGGLQFKDVAPMICGVVDNGVCQDDPRVMVRLNEATKIILDAMIPVGGNIAAQVAPPEGLPRFFILPPQFENAIEAHVVLPGDAKVFGSKDIKQGWYEITTPGNSMFLEPEQQMDNPLIDVGLVPNPTDPSDLRRVYYYPGLEPGTATVQFQGARRYLPITNDEDYLIVQNIEAIKCIILSIERYENNAIQEAQAYRQSGLEMLAAEVKKHLMDPRNFAVRKANYLSDIQTFAEDTLGWVRAQLALDVPAAMRTSKRDLTWTINQAERRLMERGMWKDCVQTIQAQVVGGIIYFPVFVEGVLALDICGRPIPIRSQFFQHLDNGPGGFPCHEMLIDQGNKLQPGFHAPRRKYKLIADCCNGTTITAVCKVRWILKKPEDRMTIKNYEAIRLMVTGKFMEEIEKWQEAQANAQSAYDILDKELRSYLAGIRHTVHVQTVGFGLGDVGDYWTK
jgi:hypothetical protein